MQHFPDLQLSFEEARVLGCLLEKEVLTPGTYPLTLNSLVTACNQTSSREPITSLAAGEVEEALRGLSEKYLVTKILGGRAPKYEHCLPHVLHLQENERAVLTILLLRGQQTAGEIKQRSERLHHFESLDEVEETLAWFIDYPHGPLVQRVPVGGGRRAETFSHLLAGAAGGGHSQSCDHPIFSRRRRRSMAPGHRSPDRRSPISISDLRRKVEGEDEPSRTSPLPEEY